MYLLFSVLCQLFICLCYSLAIFYLAVTILGRTFDKRCYLKFFVIFTLIQIVTNLVHAAAYDWTLQYEKTFSFVWNILLYSGHAAILAILLMRAYRTGAAKTVGAAAVSHFITFTATLVGLEFMENQVPAEINFNLFMVLTSVLPHLFGLLVSVLIAAILRRQEFCRYFEVFFANRRRTVVTLTCSIFLMNYHTLVTLAAPVEKGTVSTTLYSVAFIVLALIVLQFTGMYTASKEKIRAQEEIIRQQETHLALLEELQQEMRAFRHDFTNLMAGISQQACDGDLKSIQAFMKNTSNYFDEKLGNEIKHLEGVSNIKVNALRSLITAKIAGMQAQGMRCCLEVQNPVTETGMRIEDLLRCVGILIDNAVEESVRSMDKAVNIILLQRECELYAAVANTFSQKPDLAKMQQRGYSTKGGSRGRGLGSLQRITGEYPNCVTRMHVEDGLFIQEIRVLF